MCSDPIKLHVGLLDAGEPLDRRPVKHAFVGQGFFQLAGCDGDILDDTEDIGELQRMKRTSCSSTMRMISCLE
jgi:hypothetical protein